MNTTSTTTEFTGLNKIFAFVFLLLCVTISAAQTGAREDNLRSLVAAERNFSRVSEEKGTREAFVNFLADEGVIFNPLPVNGKNVWLPREKTPGILTWTPVFADVSEGGDLGFTTGPYEFRRAAGEKPVGFGYYLSVWHREADGTWKVLLDIGTRNSPLETTPALEFAQVTGKKDKKKIDVEKLRAALKAADEKLSRLLSAENSGGELSELVGNYLRINRMNQFPLTNKNDAFTALQSYQGKINLQMTMIGIARSGDFGYSYGTYTAKAAAGAENGKSAERGSFARIWRRNEKGKWNLTYIVMHDAPPVKRSDQ